MNRDNRLFSNRFINDLDIQDVASDKKEEFRRYHEKKIEEQRQKQILTRSKKISPTFNNTSLNSELYSDLAKFNPSHNIPLKVNAKENENGGNEQKENLKFEKKTIVSIDSRDRDLNRFPNQNNFTVFLGKSFLNVKKIELVSTEFPNTDQVIKDLPIQLQNNIITWQNEEDSDLNFFNNLIINTIEPDTVDIFLDNHGYTINSTIDVIIYNSKLDSDLNITGFIDSQKQLTVIDNNTFRFIYLNGIPEQGTTSIDFGFPQYTVEIKPGNYTANTLTTQISHDLGLIKRRNGNGDFHFFEVKVNLDTDVITLDSVITSQLPNNSLSTIAGSTTITVNQKGHGFKTGDRVKMIGVKNIAGIRGDILNGDYSVNVLDFNTFTYEVITRASETSDGGGNTIRTGKDAPFRLLFGTSNTRIQFNTGFPNEDSSQFIGSSNPITTKSLKISNVSIISNNKIRFTTTSNHDLQPIKIYSISSISIGLPTIITTNTPHNIHLPSRVTIRNTNSIPIINGTFFGVPIGKFAFQLRGFNVTSPGNSGEVLIGNEKIKIFNLSTVPNILIEPVFFIENIPSPNQFDILFRATSINTLSFPNTIIGTNQVLINHPNHSFNQLSSITPLNNTFANIKTFLPNTLLGSRTENVDIIAGPSGTNTVDILLNNHGIVTSDILIIKNSTSNPIVDGSYSVQVIDINSLRINFVFSTFIDGTATVLTGDNIIISNSNSLPKIDGSYSIHNRLIISNIALGSITSVITTTTLHNWSVGDIITISNTNSTPIIDGKYTIQSIISPLSFEIPLNEDVVSPGSTGIIINNNRFIIETGFQIVIHGVYGVLGRNNNVIHYRIKPQVNGSNNIADISINVLNGVLRPISKLIDIDNYIITTIEEYANETISAGGDSIVVSSNNHGVKSIQANTGSGNPNGVLFRSISLEGANYTYMVCEIDGLDLQTVLNTSNISNTFAKILLSEAPGFLMFNSFISEAKVFDNSIAKLDFMNFKIVTPEGFSFQFNDIDYSFTLRITELVEQIQDAYISSNTGSNDIIKN